MKPDNLEIGVLLFELEVFFLSHRRWCWRILLIANACSAGPYKQQAKLGDPKACRFVSLLGLNVRKVLSPINRFFVVDDDAYSLTPKSGYHAEFIGIRIIDDPSRRSKLLTRAIPVHCVRVVPLESGASHKAHLRSNLSRGRKTPARNIENLSLQEKNMPSLGGNLLHCSCCVCKCADQGSIVILYRLDAGRFVILRLMIIIIG